MESGYKEASWKGASFSLIVGNEAAICFPQILEYTA